MFNLRGNLVEVLAAAVTATTINDVFAAHDFKSTANGDEQVKLGFYPIPSAIIGVGDWRIVSRERWSWGKNLVKSEVDILLYFRSDAHFVDHTLDDEMVLLFKTNEEIPGTDTDYTNTLYSELSEAEPNEQLQENIWKRRWILRHTCHERTVITL